MWRSILVPLDGTNFGEAALPYALTLARRGHGEIRLVHVFPTDRVANKVSRTQAYLQKLGVRADCLDGIPVSVETLDGSLAERLTEHISATPCDLIVLTSHVRSTLGRIWFGSLTDEIIGSARCPVLSVRLASGRGAKTCESVRRVVVPLDGTDYSEGMLASARCLADAFAADIRLLRVIEPICVPPPLPLIKCRPLAIWGTGPLPSPEGDRPIPAHDQHGDAGLVERLRHAEVYLGRIAERLCQSGRQVTTHVAIHGDPALAILEESQPDTVVVLRIDALTADHPFDWGNVGSRVLHKAVGPVLISHDCRPAPDLLATRTAH